MFLCLNLTESYGEKPEVQSEDDGGQDGQLKLRLLEQLMHMREMLSAKEAELAEVHSKLAYAQQETEVAKEEVVGTQQELTQVRSEVKESQTRIEQLYNQLEQQDMSFQAKHLQGELQKMHEVEDLRKGFDWERRWWHALLPMRRVEVMRQAMPSHAKATGDEMERMSRDAGSLKESQSTGQQLSRGEEQLQDPPLTADPSTSRYLSNVEEGEEVPSTSVAEGGPRRSMSKVTCRVTFPEVEDTQGHRRLTEVSNEGSLAEGSQDANSSRSVLTAPRAGNSTVRTQPLLTKVGDAGTIVNTVTELLEAQLSLHCDSSSL